MQVVGVVVAAQVLLDKQGVQVAPAALAVGLGTVLPLLTALLTHITASPKVKATVNLVLSALAGLLSYGLLHHGRISWPQLVIYVAAAFGTSGAAHNHLWKAWGVPQMLAVATHKFGLGKDQALNDELRSAGLTQTDLRVALDSPAGFQTEAQYIAAHLQAVKQTEAMRQSTASVPPPAQPTVQPPAAPPAPPVV